MKNIEPVLIPLPCGKCGKTLVKVERNLIVCIKCDKKLIVERLSPKIKAMSQATLSRLWHSVPDGTSPYFDGRLPLFRQFNLRLKQLGGLLPKRSSK